MREMSEREQLEQLVAQAQKMEGVGRLAGGVAHDFNNLISAIQLSAEVIQLGLSKGDSLREPVLQILRSCERATVLTRQLLSFSRTRALSPAVLQLNCMIREMLEIFERLIGEDIELVVALSDEVLCVRLDSGQLEQLVLNLVINARDAMPRGGILVLGTSVMPDGRVCLTVSDNGCGMDPEIVPRIFEPFFTTKNEPGGLGLATVSNIVREAGGEIQVESKNLAGTRMLVILPHVLDEAPTASLLDVPTESIIQRGQETILLVEDEDGVRRMASEILLLNGYTVLPARNAGEAMLIVEQEGDRIDLLLTDIVMPHLSGSELASRLREQRPDLRVLFITGYSPDALERHGVTSMEHAWVVQKPLSMASLTQKVREVLDAEVGGLSLKPS